jgi:hypothetical protein
LNYSVKLRKCLVCEILRAASDIERNATVEMLYRLHFKEMHGVQI